MASGSAVRNGIIEQWKVELSISCSNLPNLDRFSKSDPVCFLYKSDHKHANSSERVWTLVGRTEMIRDNLNPKVLLMYVLLSKYGQRMASMHHKYSNIHKQLTQIIAGRISPTKFKILHSLNSMVWQILC